MAKTVLDLTAKYNEALAATETVIDSEKKLLETTKQVKQVQQDAGKAAEESQKKAAQAAVNTSNALKDLQKQYKQLMGEAVAAGGAQTEAGRKALSAAGELLDKIGDIKAATRAYASDTQLFDTAAGGINLVTGSYQGLLGIQSLLGDDTKDYQEQLVKLNAIMGINQAATQIQNTLQKESAFMRGLDSAATGIQTVAQKAYNVVVGESVGATKAFRLALAGTGIGLVVIGLLAAVDAFSKYRTESAKAAKQAAEDAALRKEISESAAQSASAEIANIRVLARAIQDEKLPREERLKALREYNKVADSANQISDKEISNSKLVQAAIERETNLIIARATVKAAEEQLQKRIGDALVKQIAATEAQREAENNLNAVKERQNTLQKEQLGNLEQQLELQKIEEQLLPTAEERFKKTTDAANKAKEETARAGKSIAGIIADIEDQFKTSFIGDEKSKDVKLGEIKVESFGLDLKGIKSLPLDEQVAFMKAIGMSNDAVEAAIRQSINGIAASDTLTFEEKAKVLSAFGLDKETIAKTIADAAKGGLNIEALPPSDAQIQSIKKSFGFMGLNIPVRTDMKQDDLDNISQAVGAIGDNIKSVLNDAFDTAIAKNQALIDGLNEQIKKQEELVQSQEDLQKRGLANDLASERKRLAELKKQQDQALVQQKKLQKEKMAIETAEQVSALITSAANIYMSLSPLGPIGIGIAVGTIASMIAAFATSKVLAAKAAGFAEGGYTGDGGKFEEAGTVHKGEFVMTKEKTAKHRKLLEALHKDDNAGISQGIAQLLENTGVMLPNDNLPAVISERKAAIELELRSEQQAVVEELKAVREELEQIRKKETPTNSGKGPRIEKHGGTTKIIN